MSNFTYGIQVGGSMDLSSAVGVIDGLTPTFRLANHGLSQLVSLTIQPEQPHDRAHVGMSIKIHIEYLMLCIH